MTSHLTKMLEHLGDKLAELSDEETWKRFLVQRRLFHTYSAGNQILIMFQRPNAVRVAGYQTWLKLHRQVRKGEKGLVVLAPMQYRDAETGEFRVRGFRDVKVFDISQTDPVDDQAFELPSLPPPGPCVPGTFDRLVQQMTRTVIVEPMADAMYGYLKGGPHGKVYINAGKDEQARIVTLAHELGHAHDPELEDYRNQRADCEIVADSAAFLVCQALNLDATLHVASYLRLYGGDAQKLLALANRTSKVATLVLAELGLLEADPIPHDVAA